MREKSVYGDTLELSVCTDGQGVMGNVFIARYRICLPSDGADADPGYWDGCLQPLGEYLGALDARMDESCGELMLSYEELVSDAH